jgi:hypothetical protein
VLKKIRDRSIISYRLTVAVASLAFCLDGVALWSSISLSLLVKTTALYALFVLYSLLLIGLMVIWRYEGKAMDVSCMDATRGRASLKKWHKYSYRWLIGLMIVEHCLFFCSLPVVLFHSLGLSLSDCLISSGCTGITYDAWVTTYKRNNSRRQELQTIPVSVSLSTAVKVVFGLYLAFLGVSIILEGFYFYAESLRCGKAAPGKRLSLYRNRRRLSDSMCIANSAQTIVSIIGMALLGANWFALPLALSLISFYPLYRLRKSLSKESIITPFQLRKTATICLSLLFFWLYCCGSGVSASLLSQLPLQTEDSTIIISPQFVAQAVLLLTFHLLFSSVVGVSIYIHISLSDTVQTLIRLTEEPKQSPPEPITRPAPTMDSIDEGTVVMMSETASVRQASVVSWNMKQCASCSTRNPDTVLVPCGHSVICSDCSRVLLTIPGFRCPLCCVEVFDCHADPVTPRV